MKTHYICQNSMTGAIHVLESFILEKDFGHWSGLKYTPCGFSLLENEYKCNPNLNKKSKICIKCHKSLLKSHHKNLMAHMSHLKLTGENPNDRIKV